MELFSLRKIRRICPRGCGPGPPASAYGSTDFIKRRSLATGSIARIKPIESVSRLLTGMITGSVELISYRVGSGAIGSDLDPLRGARP
jgi:hypothetical protein